jgi:hypothetical protein
MRCTAVLLSGLLIAATAANADGAFPAELQLFEPLDVPARTVLATNAGLILTEDQGQHGSFICEQAIAPQQVVTRPIRQAARRACAPSR